MNESILEITKLTRQFGSVRALDRFSMSLDRGRILALVGPNGAGKTTLLKLLAGLLAPSEGAARVLGQPAYPPSPDVAGRLGCVLNGLEPPRRVKVQQILDLRASIAAGFDHTRARKLCEEHGVPLHRQWYTLSKGQQKWVLSVAALMSGAEVLLLDEPADGLDPAARQQLYGLLRDEANQRELSVVVASHILGDVERVADEVAIVQQGQLRFCDGLEELRDTVRQVEFTDHTDPTEDLPTGAVVLGRDQHHGSSIVWLQYCDAELADIPLSGELGRRRVNLEQLYFAITQHAGRSDVDESGDLQLVSA